MAKSLILTGISGSRVGIQMIVASRQTLIGSANGCDLVLHDRHVLPQHAQIRVVLDHWFISPLDAHAQVFVNGVTVRGQQRIDEGDLVTVGTATFKAEILQVNEVGGGRRW
ncbi:forkhead-associated protein [Oscillochloris trichoides DG-6]|uniref:Forkhead-associated protein n=1 Tax=Oscillochloris trichoides DG-6 TaxID=765420 RepID=E1IID9_9CHLR|nr:FHA domain-containing protein [Oscillochloris trichoides]EFO79014.1 forkhead-associated protein [Oscillochloris trichoides DG-6]